MAARGRVLYTLRVDDRQIAMYEEEAIRLQAMLDGFRNERKQTYYVPLVGAVLAIPAYAWKSWAPALVFGCALVMMVTWWYLIYGHINERSFQLERIGKEIARAREIAANPPAPEPPKPIRVKQARL
jgi:hypothetical protein